MEILNLQVPKNKYLLDFLAEEEKRMKEEMKIKDSWILIHQSVIEQLLSNDGFKSKEGIQGLNILYRHMNNLSEEFVINNMLFRNWSVVIAIRYKKHVLFEELYDVDVITTVPKYLIMLKMKA